MLLSWDLSLQGLCVGSKVEVTSPPDYAYGRVSGEKLPNGVAADDTLFFELEVVDILSRSQVKARLAEQRFKNEQRAAKALKAERRMENERLERERAQQWTVEAAEARAAGTQKLTGISTHSLAVGKSTRVELEGVGLQNGDFASIVPQSMKCAKAGWTGMQAVHNMAVSLFASEPGTYQLCYKFKNPDVPMKDYMKAPFEAVPAIGQITVHAEGKEDL